MGVSASRFLINSSSSITPSLTDYGNDVNRFRYGNENIIGAMPNTDKKTLAELLRVNVQALMKANGLRSGAGTLRERAKIGMSGAQAILSGEGDPRISTVENVAKAFRCEAWELLHPGFTPKGAAISPDQSKEVENLAKEVESLTPAQRELLRKLVKA